MCNCFCFSATATSTLHCLMFPHPPPRDVFGPSVKFQDAKTEKKHHLPNDGFLIKFFIEKWCFLSSERLPPLSAVPPTNKKTHPPISKPHPATKSFFPPFFSHVQVLCFCANRSHVSPFQFLMPLNVFLNTNSCQVAAAHAFHTHAEQLMVQLHGDHCAWDLPCHPAGFEFNDFPC